MPKATTVKPTHKAIQRYLAALAEYRQQKVKHEGALETAFQRLLEEVAKSHHCAMIPKQKLKVEGANVFPDGTVFEKIMGALDRRLGYWEAKDLDDDLDKCIAAKIAKKYPLSNTIFENTKRAVLYQAGKPRDEFDLADKKQVASLLNEFFAYHEPEIDNFHDAVEEFKDRVPELAQGLVAKIKEAHEKNKEFQVAFESFFGLCQQTLNPNISREAVDEMLVQHLLTERLIRKIFDNPDFMHRNVIAAEIEKVIGALTHSYFDRDKFLRSLDRFYRAIEDAAHTLEDFSEKQHFLNTVYERFFQGYSVKVADTHGIVYTPQEIVDFMCASVEEVLQKEFNLTLGSKGVNILDPCTGTGNFIVNLIHRIPKRDLPRVYKEQLFANEVMLLPYYIAALNIEHAYFERAGTYEPFEGLCFVDTLEMTEDEYVALFAAENTARIKRQKDNLKRELPRIPFAPAVAAPLPDGRGSEKPSEPRPLGSGFWAFAEAGKELARLHLDYEKLEPWPLAFTETEDMPLSYKVVDKMRLSADKTKLHVNPSLTLAGIPPEVYQYRLGNRSALEWVIDQYQVSVDKRSGIRSDPNRADDEEYIVRLVGQVVRVSMETVRIVNALPESFA